ncbi:MAG: DNA polymerase IV [Propionibacteriaceae bacterium]
MRTTASVLHLDLDAFFASVEQRDKPSLRGKPVIVGGIGNRGVVATASYEARAFGVRSAMSSAEAHRRCPHGAFLGGRFEAYRAASSIVMKLLHELSPLVEQLSIDEAYVDLAAGGHRLDTDSLRKIAEKLRSDVVERTGGLTASVGLGSSKFMAKVASEMAKPDGIALVAPGTEIATIAPLPARAVPGIGPVTMERLERLGVRTVADIQKLSRSELIREVGKASGESLASLAFAQDQRAIEPGREMKSISVEHTFETDIRDRDELAGVIDRDSMRVAERVQKACMFAKTISLKVRRADFSTHTRSRTLVGATDAPETFARVAKELLSGIEIAGGVRLLGVGVSNFTEAAQEELFEWGAVGSDLDEKEGAVLDRIPVESRWGKQTYWPGVDVVHQDYGSGWVWGAGLGRVTVRFETATTPPGPVKTFAIDDPKLALLTFSIDQESAS